VADAEAKEEPVTMEELHATWQMCKAVILYKQKRMTYEEAIDHMVFFTQLDDVLCATLLYELRKDSVKSLMRAQIKIDPLPDPEFPPKRKPRPQPG